ncbi:MgtC/SapB family protein [Pseudoalteromonas sp. KG3]|uniref:Protein MgtC n=1 Tax=Pseudoalteromonas prydzensis TaxID=182141 RepID=A0ABR9FHJ4_9GAMM|nr:MULTISPECIES: MgtC/SapB family protein [Pseudoalteromonas]MBE0456294.1 MgtC/SapB family protein [Pseudoalteromonas prydzensis]WKD24135.1 MgtC/SapB family protein [Pseudoalteromonas sp. KG3]
MEFDIQFDEMLKNLVHLGIAYILSLPMAYDREHSHHGAGLRTFPLVAVASCGYALIGMSVLTSSEAESKVLEGIITGIGFIGGGAILKNKNSTYGTATAASIWNMGLIGIAVAFSRFEIAILMAFINFVTLRYVKRFK